MRILALLKQILLDLPDYFRSHPVIFLMTMAFFLFMLVFMIKGQRQIVSRTRGPAKLLRLIIGALGGAGILLIGLTFNTAGENAQIEPAYVTPGLYLELIVAGGLYIALNMYLLHRRLNQPPDEEFDSDYDPAAEVVKTGAMILYSILGLFLGVRLASWGFSIFGRTIGAWIYGLYLGYALYVVLQIVIGVLQFPLMLLAGDPVRQMAAGLEEEAETPGTPANRFFNYAIDRVEQKEEEKYKTKNEKGSKKEEHSGLLYRLFEKWDILWEERRKRKNPQSAGTGARSAEGTQDSVDRALRAIREAEAERHRKEERFLSFKEHLIGLAGIALAILAYVFLSHMIG